MRELPFRSALINGAGSGISASLTRLLSSVGVTVSVAAKHGKAGCTRRMHRGGAPIGPTPQTSMTSRPFSGASPPTAEIPRSWSSNAAQPLRGQLEDLDPLGAQRAMTVTAFGGFLAVHHAAKRMVPRGYGAILLTGNTASIKGFANSAAFAMGKFALRGLAQSAARELGPKGIHVVHFVIDGFIRSESRPDPADAPDSTLNPDDIAQCYVDALCQPRNSWSDEIVLRPWAERF